MILYLENISEVEEIYHKTIQHSGGGVVGVLHPEYLESALGHIKNDIYYPDFSDKLTHLFWSFNRNHIFQDGNKRMAITICMMFLIKNGFMSLAHRFLNQMESISYHVAAGNIDKTLLLKIITSILYEDDYSESLKIELMNAISSGVPVFIL